MKTLNKDFNLVYEPTSEPVARAIIRSDAYRFCADLSDVDSYFTWKMGVKAPVYTNCRDIPRSPGNRAIIVNSLVSSIRANYEGYEAVFGLSEAGTMWAAWVAERLGLPFGFIRKETKKHGINTKVECNPPRGIQAILVDDLMASGGSVEKAFNELKEEKNISLVGIQTIVNWGFSEMFDRFDRLDIPVKALVSYPTLIKESIKESLVTEEFAQELLFFYQNPRNHIWDKDILLKYKKIQSA